MLVTAALVFAAGLLTLTLTSKKTTTRTLSVRRDQGEEAHV
jgi:hypothetical protein